MNFSMQDDVSVKNVQSQICAQCWSLTSHCTDLFYAELAAKKSRNKAGDSLCEASRGIKLFFMQDDVSP